MPWIFQVGLALYVTNLGVGLAARFAGARFGVGHHILYGLVAVSAVAALVFAYHPALWLTVAALAFIPVPSARSVWHPALALVGFSGYLLALL